MANYFVPKLLAISRVSFIGTRTRFWRGGQIVARLKIWDPSLSLKCVTTVGAGNLLIAK